MTSQRKSVLVFLPLLYAACAPPPEPTPPVDLAAERAAVNTVLEQWDHVWLNEDLDLLSRIFVHDSDMVIYGTDAAEVFVGYDALQASLAAQFEAYTNPRLTSRDRVIHVHSSGQVAWFSQMWDFQVEVGGEIVSVEGMRLTGVLEKRDGTWLLATFHGSIPVSGQVVAY